MCNALKNHVSKVEENIHRGKLCTKTLFRLFLFFVRGGLTRLQLSHVTFANGCSCAGNRPVVFLFSMHLSVNLYAALQVRGKKNYRPMYQWTLNDETGLRHIP